MKNKKRGLSPVIATVLLLLLTIAAVAIIAGVIMPLVKNRLPESTECVSYRDTFEFEEVFDIGGNNYRYNCRDNGLHGISVRGRGGSDSKSGGFDVILVSKQGASKKISVRDGEIVENLRMFSGENKETILVPDSGVRTYVYNAGAGTIFDKYEIYPVLDNGKICPVSDKIEIGFCQTEIELGGAFE